MTHIETYHLAGKCLVLDENPEFKKDLIELIKNDLIDWQQFIGICSNNLILPAIFLKFQSHEILKFLPKDVNEHLLIIYELNHKRNSEILIQIKTITAILNEHNIFPLYLKGVGNLLDNVYSDIGERLLGDIDFLVAEEDYLYTAELMINAGYVSYVDTTHLDVEHWKHYPRLYHPNFISDVEIHRIPTHHKCNWFNQEIINTERKISLTLPGCFVQSFHHKIIHNFIHSQLSHKGYLYGYVSLRDIFDIYLLSKHFSLIDTLPETKKKNKAIAYYAFARSVFELDGNFFHKENFQYKILKKKHDLNMNSPLFNSVFENTLTIFLRVKNKYLGTFFGAFYKKEDRNTIKRKLREYKIFSTFLDGKKNN